MFVDKQTFWVKGWFWLAKTLFSVQPLSVWRFKPNNRKPNSSKWKNRENDDGRKKRCLKNIVCHDMKMNQQRNVNANAITKPWLVCIFYCPCLSLRKWMTCCDRRSWWAPSTWQDAFSKMVNMKIMHWNGSVGRKLNRIVNIKINLSYMVPYAPTLIFYTHIRPKPMSASFSSTSFCCCCPCFCV